MDLPLELSSQSFVSRNQKHKKKKTHTKSNNPLGRKRLSNNKPSTSTRTSLLLRPIENRTLNIRHHVRRQIRQLDRRGIKRGDSAMNLIELINLRMLIIVREPVHAGRRKVADDDAPVGRELDRLGGVEAVVRATLERREVLPLS